MVVLFQKQLAPSRRNPDNGVESIVFISGLIMSVSPPSRTPSRPDARTTSQNKAASYQEMGDLISRRRAPRILVVDDQPSIAGLMSQLLTIRGYT